MPSNTNIIKVNYNIIKIWKQSLAKSVKWEMWSKIVYFNFQLFDDICILLGQFEKVVAKLFHDANDELLFF
jgi:hypothetical protein